MVLYYQIEWKIRQMISIFTLHPGGKLVVSYKPLSCIIYTTMTVTSKKCPHCGKLIEQYLHPFPTVDIIIEMKCGGIILIKRTNPPFGWALPGGFVDYGESLEEAAVREAREETSLQVTLTSQLHTYSDPGRDTRKHTITTVFSAKAEGNPVAADDAQDIGIFTKDTLPEPLAFDHQKILSNYFKNIV